MSVFRAEQVRRAGGRQRNAKVAGSAKRCGFLYYCITGRLGCEHRWPRDAKPSGFRSLRIKSGPRDLGINMECIFGDFHFRSILRRNVLDSQLHRRG